VWLDLHVEYAPLGVRELLSKLAELVADRRVKDEVADAENDPPKDAGIDARGQLDLAPGLLPNPLTDRLNRLLVELDGTRDLHREQLVGVVPQLLISGADAEDGRHPVSLNERLQEAHERRLGALDRTVKGILLLLGREVGREEEGRHLAIFVERIGELR